ncbi:hypothetical protein SAMN05216553_11327 [Lentzea fradiae]|uniref:ABC-2 family transporter protein n=1 Tax=Lentzea fradiae TaxID=200378 RepID=A0A1G7Y181_9PSEU|nr:ABC transporter permease subunit [Lentzea fradiae]SDG90157.1 hypothetical protein SAMN05216553_11327 [Lentzea fradiae]
MIWATLRLQRLQLLVLIGALVVGAGVIVLLRSNMLDALASAQLTQCVTTLDECPAPDGAVKAFVTEWDYLFEAARFLIIVLPALIGVFLGAPLFAAELEQGTHVLAFTQSVSRTRWMFVKLVVALVPALVVLVLLQYLVWWWLTAAGVLGPRLNGPFNPFNFGIDHVSPAAYALVAFLLGAFLGAVTRRTLVAMTAGLTAFVALRVVLSGVASRWVPSERREAPVTSDVNLRADGGLELESGMLDAAGRPVPKGESLAVIDACKASAPEGPDAQDVFTACLAEKGSVKSYLTVIPDGSAWLAHVYDAALYGGLAVLLLAGTVWALRRQG